MREVVFLRNRKPKWDRFEMEVANPTADPDTLTELYIEVSDDLAYARTFYPESRTTGYLNNLASRAHLSVFANRKETYSRILRFWTHEVPREVYGAYKPILFCFGVLLMAVFLGLVSSANDLDYPRLILGDRYVDMTLDYVKAGNPMGVYGDSGMFEMFVRIFSNNARVALLAFVAGLVVGLGPVGIVFNNGVMLGAFHWMQYEFGVLTVSLATVYIHGTIEILSIPIEAGAGLLLSQSILFPGTYTRGESFKRGAKRGMKLIIGMLAFVFMAAVLESFVTRFYQTSMLMNWLIIGVSLLLMIGYFILLPLYRYRQDQASASELTLSHPISR